MLNCLKCRKQYSINTHEDPDTVLVLMITAETAHLDKVRELVVVIGKLDVHMCYIRVFCTSVDELDSSVTQMTTAQEVK